MSETKKSFSEITQEIAEAGKQYNEIDPNLGDMFADAFVSYLKIVGRLMEDSTAQITSNEVKMKVFGEIFKIDVEAEVVQMAAKYLESSNGNSDDDINSIDEDILKNIKSNIQTYLNS